MLKALFITLLFFVIININAQGQEYFNNIYQNGNDFAIGMTILETEDGYIGYGGTDDVSNIGQMLLLYKINKQGELLIWKPFGEDYHNYYFGILGGAMVETDDGNYALAYHAQHNDIGYSSLVRFNSNLDTIWKKDYSTSNLWTLSMNCLLTNDNGFILVGSVKPSLDELWDVLLLKTDSLGNMEWYNTYGSDLQEQGATVIETPDKGYLIGGFKWDPAEYHTMDAMVIKTDSLGNQEWTRYYGNPDVDDDMAHVAMADDGNYLVATTYGKNIIAPEARTAMLYIAKVDEGGNTVWGNYIGPHRLSLFIKNFRKESEGFILTGFSSETDTATFQYYSGWVMKLDNNLDSVWYRDYVQNEDDWDNMFYDASPTSDNGYIAIGKARPDEGGSTNKMWVVKVDSMGCDTPWCFTTVINEEIFVNSTKRLKVWPNPTKGMLKVSGFGSIKSISGNRSSVRQTIKIYNSQGLKVDEIQIPKNVSYLEVDVSKFTNGIYYIQYIHSDHLIETIKFIKN